MFAFLDCVRYNEDFVKSRFCSIRFIVILAGLKKIVVIPRASLNRGFTLLTYKSKLTSLRPY